MHYLNVIEYANVSPIQKSSENKARITHRSQISSVTIQHQLQYRKSNRLEHFPNGICLIFIQSDSFVFRIRFGLAKSFAIVTWNMSNENSLDKTPTVFICEIHWTHNHEIKHCREYFKSETIAFCICKTIESLTASAKMYFN